MPGATIGEAFSAATRLAASVGSTTLASGANQTVSVAAQLSDGWLHTAPQALYFTCVLLLGLLLLIIGAMERLPRLTARLLSCCKANVHTWGTPYPLFSQVLQGGAKHEALRSAGTGQHEKVVMDSDVVGDGRCAKCISLSPISCLFALFGIKTWRPRFTRAEFEKLPPKEVVVLGKANMSYAPQFQPRYEDAFNFAEAEARLRRESVGAQVAPTSAAPAPAAAPARAAIRRARVARLQRGDAHMQEEHDITVHSI